MELSASFTRALLSGFDRAYADLLRVATRSTGSREEAGDLVHDTWLRLAEHVRGMPGDKAGGATAEEAPRDATAYLAVMAQHMALDAQRRCQRHMRYLDEAAVHAQFAPSHAPDVADSVMYRQALAVLEDALAGLPERSRAAFVAHRMHGERQPVIAERLGVSLNTVERDLIQAHACIEDALRRWRGGSDAGAWRAGRRRSLGALLGLAGVGLGGCVGWRQWQLYRESHVQWQARWSSERGQLARHDLPDGSSLLLDAASSAEVRYFAARGGAGARGGFLRRGAQPRAALRRAGRRRARHGASSLMGHADPKSTAIYTELSIRKRTSVVDMHGPLAKITTPVSELLKRMPSARKPG